MNQQSGKTKRSGLSIALLVLGVLCVISIGFTMGAYVTKTQASDASRVAGFHAEMLGENNVTLDLDCSNAAADHPVDSTVYPFSIHVSETEVGTKVTATVTLAEALPTGLKAEVRDEKGTLVGEIPSGSQSCTTNPVTLTAPILNTSLQYKLKFIASANSIPGSYSASVSVEAVQIN